MTPRLTKELRTAIASQGGAPVYIVDADTRETFVLLSTERYQHLRPLFEPGDVAIHDTYPIQEQVARDAGWNDPAMDAYDAYDAHHAAP